MHIFVRDLVFLILQFLDEEKYKETMHALEKESGLFFNMKYCEELVKNNAWEDLEKYLLGFTNNTLDFSEQREFATYGGTTSAKGILLDNLEKLIAADQSFHGTLQFPTIEKSRLHTLISRSLCWQHQLCRYPKPSPDIKTLFVDHACDPPIVAQMSEVINHIIPLASTEDAQNSYDDLPKTVVKYLNPGASIKSMEFHPLEHTLILIGTDIGDVALWEVGRGERLFLESFNIWDLGACSNPLQELLAEECSASVNRVTWSPHGSLFGIAYSKHIVHIYSYHGGNDVKNKLEIEAHVGNVSDIAFSAPFGQLFIVTCGEDKTIKVWDAANGVRQYIFCGHEAPVYSLWPYPRPNIPILMSVAIDGVIKGWIYDHMGSKFDYDAPGGSCTNMVSNASGSRLFSCGTSEEGESYIVEWDHSSGAVMRVFRGLGKQSPSVVQFDIKGNRYLAAGDESVIKYWDIDYTDLLTTIDAEGGLPVTPCIRFSKDGALLAVSTSDNGIKILTNSDGVRRFRAMEDHARASLGDSSKASTKDPVDSIVGASETAVTEG